MTTFATVVAVTVFTVSGFFQWRRMYKTQSARDVSLAYVTCLTVGVLCTWYVALATDASTFIKVERSFNAVSALCAEAALLYYKRKDAKLWL